MFKLKSILILIILVLNIITLTACDSTIGGISINASDTVVNGTIFDTKNLKMVEGDLKGDINYSIKVYGSTNSVNDSTWAKWFGEEESDINGKIIVCMKLEYNNDIANDPDATISLPTSTDNKEELKTYKLSEVSDGDNYVYLILNPRRDLIEMTINYTFNNKLKDIKYLIDLMDVNAEVSGSLG